MLKLGIFTFLSLLLTSHPTMAGKQELQTVIQGNGLFTNELYNVLARNDGNVFFSPISVHAVLAMAHQGAHGETSNVLARALHVPNATVGAEGYKDVLQHLNNVPGVQLSMANKVYVMEGYALKPAFQEVNEKKFLTSVEPVNFANSAVAAGRINSWVEEKTKNKIKDLIKPSMVDHLTRLVLVNAIYFKGSWATKFEDRATKTEKFYLNDNDSIDVKMMNQKAKFSYKEDQTLDAKVLEMPYSNQDVSLIVILPNQRNGIAALEQKLVNYDITKITGGMYKPEVIVKLPKFKIETTIDLNEPLAELGLQVIFDPNRADFSEMLQSPEQLYVSQVIQKAFIEVNEEGTEAAAATGSIAATLSLDFPDPPQQFHADHPFVVILKKKQKLEDQFLARLDTNINYVLFQGRIANPNDTTSRGPGVRRVPTKISFPNPSNVARGEPGDRRVPTEASIPSDATRGELWGFWASTEYPFINPSDIDRRGPGSRRATTRDPTSYRTRNTCRYSEVLQSISCTSPKYNRKEQTYRNSDNVVFQK